MVPRANLRKHFRSLDKLEMTTKPHPTSAVMSSLARRKSPMSQPSDVRATERVRHVWSRISSLVKDVVSCMIAQGSGKGLKCLIDQTFLSS